MKILHCLLATLLLFQLPVMTSAVEIKEEDKQTENVDSLGMENTTAKKPQPLFTKGKIACQIGAILIITLIAVGMGWLFGLAGSDVNDGLFYYLSDAPWFPLVLHSLVTAIISFYLFLVLERYFFEKFTPARWFTKTGIYLLVFILSSLVMPLSSHYLHEDGLYVNSNRAKWDTWAGIAVKFLIVLFAGCIVQTVLGRLFYWALISLFKVGKEVVESKSAPELKEEETVPVSS